MLAACLGKRFGGLLVGDDIVHIIKVADLDHGRAKELAAIHQDGEALGALDHHALGIDDQVVGIENPVGHDAVGTDEGPVGVVFQEGADGLGAEEDFAAWIDITTGHVDLGDDGLAAGGFVERGGKGEGICNDTDVGGEKVRQVDRGGATIDDDDLAILKETGGSLGDALFPLGVVNLAP